jgi:hypothetical protein
MDPSGPSISDDPGPQKYKHSAQQAVSPKTAQVPEAESITLTSTSTPDLQYINGDIYNEIFNKAISVDSNNVLFSPIFFSYWI